MKSRVKLVLSRDAFITLKNLLETRPEVVAKQYTVEQLLDEQGPLEDLHVAVEAAWCNNANYEAE